MSLPMHVGEHEDVRASSRKKVEGLVHFAEYLAPADRALIVSVFENGTSAADLARAVGEDPRQVRRRLKRLVTRMASTEFRFVIRHRNTWPGNQRRVADAVILRGLTQREAAAELNLSLHQVRTYLHAVHVLTFEHTGKHHGN